MNTATNKYASQKSITIDADRDMGYQVYETDFRSNDTSNWGQDAYVLAYELVARAQPIA